MYSYRNLFFILSVSVIFSVIISDAKASAADGLAEKGGALFEQRCTICHSIGGGKRVGPDLQGVTERRERNWLVNWISNPEKVVRSGDPVAVNLLKEYGNIQMPTLGLSEDEISALLSYFEAQKGQKVTTGTTQLEKGKKTAEIGLVSRGYLQFFQDARGERYVPFNEYVELELRDKDRKWVFYSAGRLRYDIRTLRTQEREMDELTYAFLKYSPFKDRGLLIDAGRHFVFEGVASEQIDGISSRWEITPHTGFSLYGGRPVETEFDGKRGDLLYGGRAFQRLEKKAEAGISFLREDNDNSRYREEIGMDIWLLPADKVEFQGHSFFNNITGGWMEHSYYLRLFPLKRLTISGLFLQTNFNDAFSARTISSFSPELVGKDEGLTKIGGAVEYRPDGNITVVFNLTGYGYRKSGNAGYYGVRVTAGILGMSTGISLYRMEGDTGRLRYTESRIYARKVLNRVSLSMDALNLHYDRPFNGLRNAYSLNGAAGYKINNSFSAGVDIDYNKSPDFTNNTMVLLKLIYNFKKDL